MPDILIVDDHPMICFGLTALVQTATVGASVHVANTFREGLDLLAKQPMDLILLDLGLPGGLGVEMISRFREQQPEVKILICSARDELFNAPMYVQSGANGFLHKHSPDEEAIRAIAAVLDGKKYVSEQVKKVIFSNLVNNKPVPVDPISTLTEREKQVLKLIMEGKWLKEIGKELGIQVSTVGTQKASIFRKLDVENMIELARKMDAYAETGRMDHL